MISVSRESAPCPKGLKSRAGKVLRSLKKYERLLGLDRWWITVKWKNCDKTMETVAEPEYLQAEIAVDLTKLKEEDIDEYTRHELFHVLLWLYTSIAEIGKGGTEHAVLRLIEERTVTEFEKMPLWEKL